MHTLHLPDRWCRLKAHAADLPYRFFSVGERLQLIDNPKIVQPIPAESDEVVVVHAALLGASVAHVSDHRLERAELFFYERPVAARTQKIGRRPDQRVTVFLDRPNAPPVVFPQVQIMLLGKPQMAGVIVGRDVVSRSRRSHDCDGNSFIVQGVSRRGSAKAEAPSCD